MGSYDPLISPLCFFFLLTLFPCPGVGPPWAAVLQDKPAPPWASSSRGICPCSSMGQQPGYLLQCGLYRHSRGISASEMSIVRSCTFKQSFTPAMWSLYLCRIWHGRAVGAQMWKGQVCARVTQSQGVSLKQWLTLGRSRISLSFLSLPQ